MARTKAFEIDAVLDKAMRLFWTQGYEKTSMQDLVDNMGINRKSIYDTFGDKHTLFLKALARYDQFANDLFQKASDSETTLLGKLRAIFHSAAFQNRTSPKGCLMVNSATELAVIDPEVGAILQRMFTRNQRKFSTLLGQAQLHGELSANLDPDALASYLNNAFTGIRVMTKVSTSDQELDQIIDMTLAAIRS